MFINYYELPSGSGSPWFANGCRLDEEIVKTACPVLILGTPFWPPSERDTWLDKPLL